MVACKKMVVNKKENTNIPIIDDRKGRICKERSPIIINNNTKITTINKQLNINLKSSFNKNTDLLLYLAARSENIDLIKSNYNKKIIFHEVLIYL